MKRRQFSEEQIIGILREAEYAKLKWLLADAMLDNAGLKDLLAKKWRARLPSGRRSRGCRLGSG